MGNVPRNLIVCGHTLIGFFFYLLCGDLTSEVRPIILDTLSLYKHNGLSYTKNYIIKTSTYLLFKI